jgi:hypothetical protein
MIDSIVPLNHVNHDKESKKSSIVLLRNASKSPSFLLKTEVKYRSPTEITIQTLEVVNELLIFMTVATSC